MTFHFQVSKVRFRYLFRLISSFSISPSPIFLTHCGAKAISVHLFKFGTLYCICQPTWSVCLRKRRKFSRKSLGAIRKIPQGIPDISMMIDGQYRGNSKMYYSSVLVHMPDLHQYPSVYA